MVRNHEKKLAIDGGRPVNSNALPAWPCFSAAEVKAVEDVMRSGRVNYWTGDEGHVFESEFAAFCGAKHAVAVANGTVSLELALEALEIEAGAEVVVTPRTFFASGSAIARAGAIPVFADVDRESQNITADTISKCLTDRTRAIIVVHLAGWPADMESICSLAHKNELIVIEDCAQAVGAQFRGKHVGTFGHIGSFSFCQDKIMTTGGEGGMLVMSDDDLWRNVWSLKDHGKSQEKVLNSNNSSDRYSFRWLHDQFGTNARMTEIQSAIGRQQLRMLPSWIAKRRQLATRLHSCLSEISAIRTTLPPELCFHVYYKYYAFVRDERLKEGWNRDRLLAAINAEGVPCFSGSCSEIYRELAFVDGGFGPGQRLPVARELGDTSLMFQVHPTLTDENIATMCDAVQKVFQFASVD